MHNPAYRRTSSVTLKDDIRLLQVGFHMHKRGRGMKVSAQLPNGEIKPIYSVPNYRYTNQRSYPINPPLDLPRGSQLVVEAVFDNSTGNPAISHPEREVPEGLDMDKNEMLKMTDLFLMKGEAPYTKKCTYR